MRCEKDDIAVMVRSDFPENIGTLYRVIAYQPIRDAGDWKVKTVSRVQTNCGPVGPGEYVWAFDTDLRPIRDPGDDAQDESLLWLPVPTKEHA